MNTDYLIYKYYDGEASNPYDWEKQNAANMFWGYERSFERLFTDPKFSPDGWLRSMADSPDLKVWEEIIKKKPIDKAEFFKLWLYNLLMEHLPDKMMSDGTDFLRLYWETTSMSM